MSVRELQSEALLRDARELQAVAGLALILEAAFPSLRGTVPSGLERRFPSA